jgi:aspartyl-tRNA(Asn)/glutamyl-tRNA(Gln) amidotransferase subunit B
VLRAIVFVIARHTQAHRDGTRLVQETRLCDPATGRTTVMRTKEEADDYRYFPEPDLTPLVLDAAWIELVRSTLPELPEARRQRFVTDYGIPEYDAGVLTQSMAMAEYFERVVAASGNAKASSNWVMGELARKLKETRDAIETAPLAADALGELIALIDKGTITGPVAKDVFEKMYGSGRRAQEIVDAEGLARIDDAQAIEAMVRDTLAGHAATVAEYRAGKTKTFGFLVGQVMKAAAGKADPGRVNAAVRRFLDADQPEEPA